METLTTKNKGGRPKGTSHEPTYRRHTCGKGISVVDGHTTYFPGKYDSDESKAAHRRFVAEWYNAGRQLPIKANDPSTTINQMIVKLLPTVGDMHESDRRMYQDAMGQLVEMFGEEPAQDFGPSKLRTLRTALVKRSIKSRPDQTLTRNYVNQLIYKLQRVFDLAVSHEIIPAVHRDALKSVPPLKKGEEGVREGRTVQSVAWEVVEACLPYMSPAMQTMVKLQYVTGMRCGEVHQMRTADIDRTGEVWRYKPMHHKTQSRGCDRVVLLSVEAQELITPYLRLDPLAYLFNPKDTMVENYNRGGCKVPEGRNAETYRAWWEAYRLKHRKDPKKYRLRTRGSYNAHSYRSSIARARNLAEAAAHAAHPEIPANKIIIPKWHSHQLRHAFVTNVDREHGPEMAGLLVGHYNIKTTRDYIDKKRRGEELDKAAGILAKIG